VGWGGNLAFGEAPCLMGGRGVNSAAPRLYLIFIHMNGPRSFTANKLKCLGPRKACGEEGAERWGRCGAMGMCL